MDYTLEDQTVTLNEDLQIMHYILEEFEEFDRYEHGKQRRDEIRNRIQVLCYRIEKDLHEVKQNIEKVIEKEAKNE